MVEECRIITIVMCTTAIILFIFNGCAFSMNITVSVEDSYISTFTYSTIPLVFGTTDTCAVGILSFNSYGAEWNNGSEALKVSSNVPSKMYLFFTKKGVKKEDVVRRAELMFSGAIEDYGRVTVGYSLNDEKIVRVIVKCNRCSLTKKWYLAYGMSTIVFRNDGIIDDLTRVEVEIL